MLAVTHLVGFGAGGRTLKQITDYTGTTNIGDMVQDSGLAAAFDGNKDQNAFGSASFSPGGTLPAYVGKQWAGGAAKTIGRFAVTDPNNQGFSTGVDVTLSLYGKNGAPSGPTDGTLLFTSPMQTRTVAATTYDTTDANTINVATAFTHHWITVTPNGAGGSLYVTEVEFWELV